MMKGTKPTVLVVEDDEPIRNLIVTTLEMEKYKFDTAEDGKQAIMLAAANNPDIILMDLGLPDMDGIDVIKKIRSWSVAPIIVISARSDERDKVAALDVGADDYLTKPFSVVELSARLRATIRRVQYIMHTDNTNESIFQNGDLMIDYSAGVVKVAGIQPFMSLSAECRKSTYISVYFGKSVAKWNWKRYFFTESIHDFS